MNRRERKQFFLIFLAVIFSVGAGACVATGWYGLSFLLLAATAVAAFRLAAHQNRTIRDLHRFVNAIRFEEFNISFCHSLEKGLEREIGERLEEAVGILSEKTQQKEGRLSFYELLLNRIDFAIIVINTDGRVTWINKAAVNMVGRLRELSDLRKYSPEAYEAVRRLKGQEMQTVKLADGHGGKDVSVSVVEAYIRGDNMRIISLKNIRPIIEQTESEAWKKLISILRHEIMNSMTPIISLAETFLDPDADLEPDIIHKTMQTIHRRSRGLVEFVRNYKRLTDIPAPQIRTFQVREMLEDVTTLLKVQDIRFTCHICPDNLTIKADRMQMEQVMINLIKNAWEASCGNERPVVCVDAGLDNCQRPQITVSDNGEGILPDVRKRIFIPFFTTKKDGSGIGLNICKQIVNAHGGSISVTSTPNKGSCFVISL
jgi:nitrogen fixation/metabolism regulation signal transduction histidine kinase